MGDRVQFQQVLMNLMINSIEATKSVEGTRELAIKSQRTDNEQLQVSVSDTGVGLRISRSIIESHGGRLWAAGRPGRGSRITSPAALTW
jgi:signal transduction histidine kinase